VCVPTTRLARPSAKWPTAYFSLDVSAMNVDDGGVADLAQRASGELLLDGGEGIVERVHEDAAHDVHHENARAVRSLIDASPAAGRAGRIIGGADQPRLPFDEDQRFLLVEGMVAEGDAIRAGGEDFLADRLGDAEAMRRVLAVHDDEVELASRV
jgi:hypothetical protein